MAELVSIFSLEGLAFRKAGCAFAGRGAPAFMERAGCDRGGTPAARRAGRPRLRRFLERGAGSRTLRTALRSGPHPGTLAGSGTRDAVRGWANLRSANGGGSPPHPRDRDRATARENQISPGRVRVDAALIHLAAAAAHGRSAVGGAAAQAEFPPSRRTARIGRRNRRDQRNDRRPAGPAGAL